MAEVFAGHSIGDHGFQKPVAIKRLLPELANDEVFVERLIGEAKLLVGMQHGNIVSVLDLARDGDDVFLVMEFVDGPSLRQLLKARAARGLPLGVATYIVQASAAGLEFAHARPGGAVIHADISPSNLLLTTSGEVRVADFGIARREGLGQGIVEGKWAYMAPEQARGEALTPRSDVFALGVVLYELICGAHPFGRQVTHEERDSQPMRVIPPRVVKPSIPHGLDAICMRALAHDPRERYARMQQMIDALVEERFSNGFREGASDLAAAIREVATGVPALQQPRTMVTDRPVTIATRSLIKELTPVRRSSPSVSGSASSSNSIPRVQDSGARTNNILTEDILRAAAMLQLPANLRADGTPMPPFRMPDGSMPSNDLASVVGGHTMSGAQAGAAVVVEQRSSRWAFGILGIAAVLGVVAAVAIQLAPSDSAVPAEPAPPLVMPQTPPPTTLDQDLSKVAPSVATTQDPVPAPPPPEPTPTITEAAPAPEAPVAPEPTPAPAPENTRKATPRKSVVRSEANQTPGYLRVGMQDGEDPVFGWATVTGGKIGSIKHDTPHKFELPPGRYTIKFKSDEHGRTITRQVVITAGNTTVKTVDFEVDK
jgi:serine/threonine protein kinase